MKEYDRIDLEVAMFLSSGDPDMYDGALFSYQRDFLDYLRVYVYSA